MAENHPSGQDQDMPPLATFTREDFLARAAAVQERMRQQDPTLDLKLSSGLWEPLFDLTTVMNVRPMLPFASLSSFILAYPSILTFYMPIL